MTTINTDLKKYKKFSKKKKAVHINDVRTSHLSTDMIEENQKLLERCRAHYESLSDFRTRRLRSFNYYRGRQWSDIIEDDDGNLVPEEDYIKSRGKIPFKQNVIRQLLRNIIGQMLLNKSKSIVNSRKSEDNGLSEMLTNTLQSIQELNEINLLDPRNFEEFLLSGAMISKTEYDYWDTKDREDVITRNVSPNNIFFNTDVKDPRLLDIRIIGEIKDTTLDKIIVNYAKNEREAEIIRDWYSSVTPKDIAVYTKNMGTTNMSNLDFYAPDSPDVARIIEVWEKVVDYRIYVHDRLKGTYYITKRTMKEIDAENKIRIAEGLSAGMEEEDIPLLEATKKFEQFWVVKHLTPYGQCLFQSETPYKHQEHPYTITLYPLIDNEVWGLVEDIIDQQRNINRLFALLDFIMGAAAKGVLLVHEDSIPKDMNIDDFAEEWTKYNGVIKFKGKPGVPIPHQVSANSSNIGAKDMLAMQLNAIQEISGVSGAIQGHEAKAGTPNSLYVNQAANSSTNIKDIMNAYYHHKIKRDEKMLKLAIQYYKEKRYIKISGNRYNDQANFYDPDKVTDFNFDLVISEGTDTPVFRQIISDQLFQLLQANKISLKMYLENSGMPYADQLLASLNNEQKANSQNEQMTPEANAIMQQLMKKQLTQTNPQGEVMNRTRIQ